MATTSTSLLYQTSSADVAVHYLPSGNPLATVTPCPVGKFVENLYCSYVNIFVFTLYITFVVLGAAFTIYAIISFLKRDHERYAACLRDSEERRRITEEEEEARNLTCDLEAQSSEETRPILDDTTNYGGILVTTFLPRRRRRGVGEVEIGRPEDGAIARRRHRSPSVSPSVATEADAAEAAEMEEGELRFELL